jgi:hypothetical protein
MEDDLKISKWNISATTYWIIHNLNLSLYDHNILLWGGQKKFEGQIFKGGQLFGVVL